MSDARDSEGETAIPGEQDDMVRFEGGPIPFNELAQTMPLIVENKDPVGLIDKWGRALTYRRDRTRWTDADGNYVVMFLE